MQKDFPGKEAENISMMPLIELCSNPDAQLSLALPDQTAHGDMLNSTACTCSEHANTHIGRCTTCSNCRTKTSRATHHGADDGPQGGIRDYHAVRQHLPRHGARGMALHPAHNLHPLVCEAVGQHHRVLHHFLQGHQETLQSPGCVKLQHGNRNILRTITSKSKRVPAYTLHIHQCDQASRKATTGALRKARTSSG